MHINSNGDASFRPVLSRKAGAASTELEMATRPRASVPRAETWNLTRVFSSDAAWERTYKQWLNEFEHISEYKGKLHDADTLAAWLSFESDLTRRAERLILYAYLKMTEDVTNPKYQDFRGRMQTSFIQLRKLTSFVTPELLALSNAKWNRLVSSPCLQTWQVHLARVRRMKPHTLGAQEEKLIAATGDMAGTASHAFSMLNDSDLTFKPVRDAKGVERPLTSGTFQTFLHAPNRDVRKQAFFNLYEGYDQHQNTLAALLAGSIKKDVFYARAKNFPTVLDASLFSDEIPHTVYNNLIAAIRRTLPTLYRYYEIRRKRLRLRNIHFYDANTPLIPTTQKLYPWEAGVQLVLQALQPLGKEYIRTLQKGLTTERWCDRYENKNKQSGAFSYPSYDASPYLMLNYTPELLDSVFTLAHEAGHSMHSWYSAKSQLYQYYDYPIFLAEIASTFNEELLSAMLLEQARDPLERANLLCREIDAIRATIFRQAMFSEFERQSHEIIEQGGTLTAVTFRQLYRALLEEWFGPNFTIDAELELECFRIPHFYRPYYVYQYATGLSAAMTLALRVRSGGEKERQEYFELLTGGCAAAPLEILARAGVDMTRPDAIDAAMTRFAELVDELESTLQKVK
ncbi:MAG: oligoendopeptidase F [Planctomycetia bacterium]|nr:oligoendopeptidase F [Planctomycetia bacterium]